MTRDYEARRTRMVAEQVEARGITSPRVLKAMEMIPRHKFVPEALIDRAYTDSALPIGEGQTISQPFVVARTVAALELSPHEKVLEVGLGSGYQAAVLGQCAKRVYGIERVSALATRARSVLESLAYTNIVVRVADGTYGWAEHAPFDAIAVAAAGPEVPQPLLDQLALGGRLVMPTGSAESQILIRVVRTAEGFEREELEHVQFVPLLGRFGAERER